MYSSSTIFDILSCIVDLIAASTVYRTFTFGHCIFAVPHSFLSPAGGSFDILSGDVENAYLHCDSESRYDGTAAHCLYGPLYVSIYLSESICKDPL